MKYIFDTNILIYYVEQQPGVEQYFTESFVSEHEIITSPIIRIEILSYAEITKEEEFRIEEILSTFGTTEINKELEDIAIHFRKEYKLKLGDAIIAATAFQHSATLVTNNTKDFRHIPEITIETPTRKK